MKNQKSVDPGEGEECKYNDKLVQYKDTKHTVHRSTIHCAQSQGSPSECVIIYFLPFFLEFLIQSNLNRGAPNRFLLLAFRAEAQRE